MKDSQKSSQTSQSGKRSSQPIQIGYDGELMPEVRPEGKIKKRKSLRKLHAQRCFDDPDFWTGVVREVSLGGRLTDIADSRNIPYKMLRDEIAERPEVSRELDQAKQDLGEMCGNKVIQLSQQLEQEAPYVAMKGYMWAASRLAPEAYGDKKQIKVEKTTSEQHIIELREMQRDRDLKVINAETE